MTKINHVPTEHEVETFSGLYVDTNNPSSADITLEDIAHALSQICRYGGHCNRFYSVAEHAVMVSKRLRRRGASQHLQIAGLHHDDAEAFLGDIPRPLKPLLGEAYAELTQKMDDAIVDSLFADYPWFDSTLFHHPDVKEADNWTLFVEARHLLPSEGRAWDMHETGRTWSAGQPSVIVTPDYWMAGLHPHKAEKLFLEHHKEIIYA